MVDEPVRADTTPADAPSSTTERADLRETGPVEAPSTAAVTWTPGGPSTVGTAESMSQDRSPTWLRGWRWGALVAALYVLATIVMTWPFARHIGDSTVAAVDPVWGIWANRWVQHQLVSDPRNLYQANIFYPLANTLGYSDAMVANAVLTAPIFWLTGNAILTNGLLTLATFPLAAGGMYALVRRLSGNRAAAFLAGLAFAFVPFRFAHIRHAHLLGHAWTPWVLVGLLALAEKRTWRWAVGFGLLLAVQALTSVYLMFQVALPLAIALLVVIVAERRARSWRFAATFGVALALAALLVVPTYLPYLAVRDEQGLQRTIYEAEYWKGLPSSHLKPWNSRLWRWTNQQTWQDLRLRASGTAYGNGYNDDEDAIFSGGLALLGALVGLAGWRRRRFATGLLILIGVAAFILSLGPSLGPRAYLPSIQPGPPLPYKWLFDHATVLRATRVTARYGVVVNLAVVALAGLGVAWSWERLAPRWRDPRRRSRAAFGLTALLALLLLGELWTWPIPTEAIDTSDAAAAPYRWLAEQPDGPVMEFPASPAALKGGTTGQTNVELMMYWSTIHWKPLVNGYSGFFPKAHLDYLAAFDGTLKRADGTTTSSVSHVERRTAPLLQDLGVKYVVVHRDRYAPAEWPAVAKALAAADGVLTPGGDFGNALVFAVKPGNAVPPVSVRLVAPTVAAPGATWEAGLAIRSTGRPALLYLREPLELTMTWTDGTGQIVRRTTRKLGDLPSVVRPAGVFCSPVVASCRPLRAAGNTIVVDPGHPNRAPETPGTYRLDLSVTGAVSLSCHYQVTISTATPAETVGAYRDCATG